METENNNYEIRLKKNIKKYLYYKDVKASDLSRLSGVSKQTISDWTAGLSPKGFINLKKLAITLNTTIDELLFGDIKC